MDDPPNPNPHNSDPNSNRFLQSSHSHPKPPFPHFLRPQSPEENDEESEEESNEENDDLVNGNDDQESSEESRGKRRKLDRFEFAPRIPPPTIPITPAPPAKNSRTFARNPLADWTEDETSVLLEAWGDRYVKNGRKSLRSDEWNEVAKRVCESSRIPRSDSQCRNRVDTLKKKYKKELAKLSGNPNFTSGWIYFKKMDGLMTVPPVVFHLQPEYGVSSFQNYEPAKENDGTRDCGSEEDGDGDGDSDSEEDESEGLPPRREGFSRGGSDSSFRMLADSIQKFGEVYEKMEANKRRQMAELERMRKELRRDLEVRSRQILERAQAEIAKLREEEGEEEGDDDDSDDDDDSGDGGSAENLSGFLAGSVYLTLFAG